MGVRIPDLCDNCIGAGGRGGHCKTLDTTCNKWDPPAPPQPPYPPYASAANAAQKKKRENRQPSLLAGFLSWSAKLARARLSSWYHNIDMFFFGIAIPLAFAFDLCGSMIIDDSAVEVTPIIYFPLTIIATSLFLSKTAIYGKIWLNKLYSQYKEETKEKNKASDEQMTPLGDLFELLDEDVDEPQEDELPGWAAVMKVQVRQTMEAKARELEYQKAQPGYSERVAESNKKYIDRERGTPHKHY